MPVVKVDGGAAGKGGDVAEGTTGKSGASKKKKKQGKK